MAEQVSDRIRIDAPPQRCYEVAIDYERYPEWAKDIKQATVLERDDADAVTHRSEEHTSELSHT